VRLPAEALELVFLNGAQEPRLKLEDDVADLVKKKAPWSASSNRPRFRVRAPVNAPFSYPNSSLSSSPEGMAAQFKRTNVLFERELSL